MNSTSASVTGGGSTSGTAVRVVLPSPGAPPCRTRGEVVGVPVAIDVSGWSSEQADSRRAARNAVMRMPGRCTVSIVSGGWGRARGSLRP